MGWRGALRSAAAARRRAEQERLRSARVADRALAKVDHSADQVLKKAYSLETQIEKDIIKALGLRYSTEGGFSSDPFDIKTDAFSGHVNLVPDGKDDAANFEPAQKEVGGVTIHPLVPMFTQWATVVALKIQHENQTDRVPLRWVKKTERSSSKVLLLDTENNQYYYPLATDLTGDVLPGFPRIGLIAFEPFRKPTTSFTLQIVDVRLGTKTREIASFSFVYRSPELPDTIQKRLSKESLPSQIRQTLDAEVAKLAQTIQKKQSEVAKLAQTIQKKQSSGCLVTIAFCMLGAGGLLFLLSR